MATSTGVIKLSVERLLKEFSTAENLANKKHKFTLKLAPSSSECTGEIIIASYGLISDLKFKYFGDRNVELTEELLKSILEIFNHLIHNESFTHFDRMINVTDCLMFVSLKRDVIFNEVFNEVVTVQPQLVSSQTLLYPYFDFKQPVVSMETGRLLMVTQLLSHFNNRKVFLDDNLSISSSPFFSSILKLTKSLSSVAAPTSDEFINDLLPWATEDSCDLSLIINCELFLKEHNLYGRNNVPKTIKTVEVANDRKKLTEIGQLSYNIYTILLSSNTSGEGLIVLTVQKLLQQVQQSLVLVLMALYNRNSTILNQLHVLVVGPVSQTMDIETYVNNRFKHTTLSCQTKYGSFERGSELDTIATTMCEAAVKFELLSTDPKSKLKVPLDVTDTTTFEGCFVLYNYARMATLERNYQLQVKKGIYPQLPATVDCSVLTDEAEWELIYNYVFLYPQVIEETKHFIGCHNIIVTCGLKKLCQFLVKMCHLFSCYYSRVKILMLPETDLLPLIQTRMRLVLTLKKVLHDGLCLLQIAPLDQL